METYLKRRTRLIRKSTALSFKQQTHQWLPFKTFLSSAGSMAATPSKFEQMVINNGPIQTSIIRNLTRWEFRNLLLAGVRIPVDRTFLRKYLIPNRCNELDPERSIGMVERCTNTTERFDDIKACSGGPLCIAQRTFLLEKRIGAEKMKLCLQGEPWRRPENNPDDNELNTNKYPIHTKVCRRCRDFYAAEVRDHQLEKIAGFRTPLCKEHSLELANQLPLNNCRCFDYINHKWRCKFCCSDTLYYLNARAFLSRSNLMQKKVPWSRPWAYLKSLWVSQGPLCPIKGCFEQPWLDETRERMQLCMGCNAICRA